MLDELQTEFDQSVRKMAENKLLKKLNEQGLQRSDLSMEKFEELLSLEMSLLKSDGKKVGAGIGIGILFSIITGGIF